MAGGILPDELLARLVGGGRGLLAGLPDLGMSGGTATSSMFLPPLFGAGGSFAPPAGQSQPPVSPFPPAAYAGRSQFPPEPPDMSAARAMPALPMQQQPTAPAYPAQQQAGAPAGGGFLSGLMNYLGDNSNMLMGLGAGIAQGGIGKGLEMAPKYAQLDTKSSNTGLAIQALRTRGVDEATARAAVANPALMAAVLKQVMPSEQTSDITEYNFARQQGFAGSLADWMARKRSGAGEYGLQPIYGVDAGGNARIMQLGKGGEAIASKLPEGITVSKEPIKIDAGTHFVLLDPITRATIATVPKQIAEAAAQEKVGAAQGEARVALPGAEQTAQQALGLIEQVRKHPGKEFGVGFTGLMPPVAGTSVKDFTSLLDQLKGRTFLQAFESLKGGGAITEVEGKKAEQAIARLDRTQSKAGFEQALTDLESVIKLGVDRARTKAGATAPAGTRSDPLGLR